MVNIASHILFEDEYSDLLDFDIRLKKVLTEEIVSFIQWSIEAVSKILADEMIKSIEILFKRRNNFVKLKKNGFKNVHPILCEI